MKQPPEHRHCGRCGRLVDVAELNVEATIHHGVRRPICYDRKVCERARRKAARKSE